MKPILFIHPRRGLFQLTSCQSCHYKFGCDNCDCNLTTYRTFESNMQLLCHQCQSYCTYPKVCPMCKNNEIGSNFGGVDELIEVLKKDFKKEVIKVESKNIIDYESGVVYVTTRIFDPSLEYNKFGKIIFVHAENLLASPDYLVNEDVHRSLAELFLQIDETTEVVFDTSNPDLPFFVELAKLNSSKGESETYSESFDEDFIDEDNVTASPNLPQCQTVVTATTVSPQEVKGNKTLKLSNPPDGVFRLSCRGSDLGDPDLHFSLAQDDNKCLTTMPTLPPNKTPNIITWYTDFVEEESKNRQKFKFPPFDNLILLTTQEKSKEKSIQKINSARQYLFGYKNELQSITIGSPYQAKFLKRKGMFSHHLLVKFPRQYSQYFQLRDIVKSVASTYNLQARLNPRHLF
jgi:primosomal protein N'